MRLPLSLTALILLSGIVLAQKDTNQRGTSNSTSPTKAAQQKNASADRIATDHDMLRFCLTDEPKELFEVTRVVDGDTIWIQRNGKREKLRLLSVDTEEKFMESGDISPSKPCTAYGDESAGWAQGFFSPHSLKDGPVRVGLIFPGGKEARGNYGRLLCHVVTEEGVDFNLLLVRRGMSPYFNKYSNSRICHERFVEAQKLAQKEQLGIWNPRTNKGGKSRPYGRLMNWWNIRANAIADFEKRAAAEPLKFANAEDPDALQHVLNNGDGTVTVLATIFKVFEEDDGSRTVAMRSGDKRRALRVIIPKDQVPGISALDLEGSMQDFRQNYLIVTGKLGMGPRGFQLTGASLEDWRRAGPEPGK